MYGSRNDFFKQSKDKLTKQRRLLVNVLSALDRSEGDKSEYLFAYNYFCNNPEDYDGATVVKDLVDVRKGEYYLDADAMLHDYEYVIGEADTIKDRWICDKKYIKNMELNGKGIRVPRLIILTVYGFFTISYKKTKGWLKRKK
tara:strand:+ start:363 stop:791 length:429 start_codon:yes stop_codon:yes gene_type:complete